MSVELINRKDLGDIEYLINEYSWLLSLNDENLVKEVVNSNNVQNALSELLGFVEEVTELPVITTEIEYYGGNPNIENTIHSVGFILLMILMIYITYHDITRLLFK